MVGEKVVVGFFEGEFELGDVDLSFVGAVDKLAVGGKLEEGFVI